MSLHETVSFGRSDWERYAQAMRSVAAGLGTTIYCGQKNNRLKIEVTLNHDIPADQLASQEILGELIELVSEFPPGFFEMLQAP